MRELRRSEHDDADDVYFVERVVTDSVEKRYDSGELNEVLVTATWKKGDEWTSNGYTNYEWDSKYTVNALYSIQGDNETRLATLVGVYPDTSATGELLWRHTLLSLRALDYTAEVVDESTADSVGVGEPLAWLREHYEKGVEN